MVQATKRRIAAILNVTVLTAMPLVATASDCPTYGHDSARSGNAAGESAITPSTVGTLTLNWSAHLDGKVTA